MMIEREQAFNALAEQITDELVVTGIASQMASWYKAKHRPENLYLRGPMGLSLAVGLGVALAHPERKVVVIEGDGSVLMGLTSLVAVAHCQPKNLMIVCMDNGIYEEGGKGATVNAGRTDFVKTVQGVGIMLARTASDLSGLREAIKECLTKAECSFLHVRIGPRVGPIHPTKLRSFEMKYQFLNALKGINQSK
jgi:thiamine pyrophosphate-dependent acetolactate synthase large subunit-like protein